ncbi:MAG: ABC transporter transmembrane domain-containing protein, partial [Rhabdochlamydiaceae bacterium]
MNNTKTNSKALFLFIWKFLSIQRWKFFFIFLLSLVWSLDATIWPYLLRRIIDIFTQHDGDRAAAWPTLIGFLIWGGLLWIIVESGFRGRDFLQARAIPKLEADIRMAMFDHIQHHSPKYFNEHFSGSLSNKINDMTTQVTLLLQNMMIFIPAIATCALSIIFFYEVSPLFAVILGGWIFIHLAVCFAFAKKCAAYSNIHGEARSTLAGKIVDSLTNNFTVNLFFRFRFEKSQIEICQSVERAKNYQARNYATWMFLWLSILFIVGGFTLNGFMIMRWMGGGISTGEIIQIFNTTWNVIMILWFAGEVIPQFFQSIGIASQALSVMHDPQDVFDSSQATALSVTQGEIIFENVSFHYGEKQLFHSQAVHI